MPEQPVSILLADDEPLFGKTTARFLEKAGYRVTLVADGHQVSRAIASGGVEIVIADLDMPGNRDLELLSLCRRAFPSVPFLVVTGRPTLPSAIQGIRLGIHDYFLKPIDLDDLLHSLPRALPTASHEVPAEQAFAEILGSSQAVQRVRELAAKVAVSNANVLIRGESGTGKELLARGIHAHGLRRAGPFVTVDCASIPDALLESTLFGHQKGAFTGADTERQGLILSASGGTLFLDEVGELPLLLQAKLLRVLQFGTILPIGSVKEQKVDVRVVAATNRDLIKEVEAGRFRLDLYYRLAVLELVSPPLRERLTDIRELAQHVLARIATRDQVEKKILSAEAVQALEQHDWPGNVRELGNVMERCQCLGSRLWLSAQDIEEAIVNAPRSEQRSLLENPRVAEVATGLSYRRLMETNEREYLERLLARHGGNVSRAAKEAGMSRQGLHKAMQRLSIDPRQYRLLPGGDLQPG
jgi:two-component system response regulator AtoC